MEEWEEGAQRAGVIRSIRVENFMCHSNLAIDLIDHVNFITGQNGSGKSALLTALTVAFGINARGTQRANTLKDFIKTGCSYALVCVELKNEGEDAFKHEVYGDIIFVERRITASGVGTFTVKDCHGKKVAAKKDEVLALVEHFNIEVQNPCVIMTQDKSKEFLHSGSAKEKFKLFFKSTLLQQVKEVLDQICDNVTAVTESIVDMETGLETLNNDLIELAKRIEKREELEKLSSKTEEAQKKLAWSWVYDADRKFSQQMENLEKFRNRIPHCQKSIDDCQEVLEKAKEAHAEKYSSIEAALAGVERLREEQNKLRKEYDQAARQVTSLEEECGQKRRLIRSIQDRLKALRGHASDLEDRLSRETQAEEEVGREEADTVKSQIESTQAKLRAAEQQEQALRCEVDTAAATIKTIASELDDSERRQREMTSYLRRLETQRTNKVTAFGGAKVPDLLTAVEQHRPAFSEVPIGPIGNDISLVGDSSWSLAVELAVGGLLNSFVVNNQSDLLLLRRICKDVQYRAEIVIYDFHRPLISPPRHMLPDPSLTTVMSVISSDNHTIMNVLIDQGGVERQVLAADYDAGKRVAFGRGLPNVKEVYTKDGLKMFSRAGVETTLPRNRRIQGRLGTRVDDQINEARQDKSQLDEVIKTAHNRKRAVQQSMTGLQDQSNRAKRRREQLQRCLAEEEAHLRRLEEMARAAAAPAVMPKSEEIDEDILQGKIELQGKQEELRSLEAKLARAKELCDASRARLDTLRASAARDSATLQEAEQDLATLDSNVKEAESHLAHYKRIMEQRVCLEIREAEQKVAELRELQEERRRKASLVCSEGDLASFGAVGTPDELQSELKRLQQRSAREQREDDCTLEELANQSQRLQKKIAKRAAAYEGIKKKLGMVNSALEIRYNRFMQNAKYLKRQLTWNFNGHLRKNGCSGTAKVDYGDETLELSVVLPQDASTRSVKDTRALSGGERSFSTLAFALALHQMTESPFRAMDEFDVFMDDVRRKISLATVVDFALKQGSQWIFITPHDISSVEAGPKVRKTILANPRT